MTQHHAASRPQRDVGDLLRRDPYLRAVYRANSLSDLTAIVQGLNITNAQQRAAMLGVTKLAWLLLRRLSVV